MKVPANFAYLTFQGFDPAYQGVCKLDTESSATKAIFQLLPVTELWGVAK